MRKNNNQDVLFNNNQTKDIESFIRENLKPFLVLQFFKTNATFISFNKSWNRISREKNQHNQRKESKFLSLYFF